MSKDIYAEEFGRPKKYPEGAKNVMVVVDARLHSIAKDRDLNFSDIINEALKNEIVDKDPFKRQEFYRRLKDCWHGQNIVYRNKIQDLEEKQRVMSEELPKKSQEWDILHNDVYEKLLNMKDVEKLKEMALFILNKAKKDIEDLKTKFEYAKIPEFIKEQKYSEIEETDKDRLENLLITEQQKQKINLIEFEKEIQDGEDYISRHPDEYNLKVREKMRRAGIDLEKMDEAYKEYVKTHNGTGVGFDFIYYLKPTLPSIKDEVEKGTIVSEGSEKVSNEQKEIAK